MKQKHTPAGFALVELVVVIVVVAIVVAVGVIWYKNSQGNKGQGQDLSQWQDKCQGQGTVSLNMPMNLNDVEVIDPMGLLAGAHVTPIDHLYFYPKDMQHRDAAPVYAMADGYIVDYQDAGDRIRIVMQHSCTFFTYFDLLTSLDKGIETKLKAGDRHVAITVGQQIGKVGAQSLDTAVYNLDLTLPGFVKPSSYVTEAWKIHTDDFFKYFSQADQQAMLALNPRKAEPYSGKIDYDIAGKLVGNWFVKGTNGYAGPSNIDRTKLDGGQGYYSGHFSIAPDGIFPTQQLDISIGNYLGKATQFAAVSMMPNPAEVDVNTGLVTYDLALFQAMGGNAHPSPFSPTNAKIVAVILLQVLDNNELKLEVVPGKTSQQVSQFSSAAQIYER